MKILRYKNGEEEIRIYRDPIHPRPPSEFIEVKHDDEPKNPDRAIFESLRRTREKVYQYARSTQWEWFVTLTFNPEKVDSFNYYEVTKKLSKWLNNIRRKCPNMAYIGVPELHLDGRYHFHFLMSGIENLSFVDSGLIKRGRKIYNIDNYKLGYTTATKISDTNKASGYLVKYISKTLADSTKGKKRYWCSKNLKVPDEIVYMMSPEQIEDLKESIKEKTTFSKVVGVKSGNFTNEIEYIQILD